MNNYPYYVFENELTLDTSRKGRLECWSYICGGDVYAIIIYLITVLVLALVYARRWGIGKKFVAASFLSSIILYFMFGFMDSYIRGGWGWGGIFFRLGFGLVPMFVYIFKSATTKAY